MSSERGSTLPLVIGLTSLLIITTLTCGEIQSYYLQRTRALADARFAALFVAKQIAGVPPVIGLDYGQAVTAELPEAASVSVVTKDGKTLSATVCYRWDSLFGLSPQAEICDTAKARTIA